MSITVNPSQGHMTILHKLDQLLESVHKYIMRYGYIIYHETIPIYFNIHFLLLLAV
jgi:hypothetical protein